MLTRAPAALDPGALLAPLAGARGMLLAVSGGPDSMALLALADEWRRDSGVPVSVATVDHGLRPQSRAEAEAVAATCAARGLPHSILEWRGEKPATGLPAAARAARYAFLAQRALDTGADTIVTAHHADDQAETVLMRLARGSGPAGLAGMAALAPLPGFEKSGLRLARPLLGVAKADLVAFCRTHGLACFDDPTNHDEAYRRPQVRRLAAMLEAEGLGRAELLRLASRAGRAERALSDLLGERLATVPARRTAGLFEIGAVAALTLPEEGLIRLLSAEIVRIGGGSPRLEQVEALADRLRREPRVAATLAGVRIRFDGRNLTLDPAPPRKS